MNAAMLPIQFLIVLPFLVVGLLLAGLSLRTLRQRWLSNRSRRRFQDGLAELLRYAAGRSDPYALSTLLLPVLPGHTIAVYRTDALHGMRLLQLRTNARNRVSDQFTFAEETGTLEDWTRSLLAQGIEAGIYEEPLRMYCVRILAGPGESLWAFGQLASSDWLPPLHSLAERLQPIFADREPAQMNATLAPRESTRIESSAVQSTGDSTRMSRLIHDVRLPLARVFAMVENLQLQLEADARRDSETQSGPDFRHTLARLQRQLRTLESFTYDILNVEQDGRAAIDRSPETIQLAERVDAVLDAHRDIMDRKRIELFRDYAADCELQGHPIALDRILFNLLTNSFQFCSSPGQLHLRILSRRQHLVVDLEDSGPGLVSQENAFELSRRNIGRSGSGWGIGLASARELTHRLGGRLVPAAPRAGPGARFLLVLPARSGHAGES